MEKKYTGYSYKYIEKTELTSVPYQKVRFV